MIVVLDQAQAHRDLAAAVLRCPGCAGALRQWGFARARSLRLSCGGRTSLRPRRVRCRACAVTHVLLPAQAPARHAYAIDVVGKALLASARGQGHRTIGAELAVPADTVRGWISRATGRAEWRACRAPSARTSATRCCRPASRPARRWLTHCPRSARPQRPSCACSADRAALAHQRHARPRSASRPATQRLNTAQLVQPCPHGGDSLTTADSMTAHRSSDTVSFRGSTSSPNTSPSSSSNATVNTWRVWGARPAAYTGCTDGAGATPRHAVPDAEACLPPMTPTSSGCCAAACRSPVVSGASARLTSSGSSGRRRGRVGEPSH